MFGWLRKSNFSLEKLSLYSLMLVFETTGISSPAWVPARRKQRMKIKTLFLEEIGHDSRQSSLVSNEGNSLLTTYNAKGTAFELSLYFRQPTQTLIYRLEKLKFQEIIK